MAGDFRIPRFYKTLLALALVLGPIYWLMFTPDGKRRTDIVILSLLGRPAFDAALDAFDDRLTESRLRESFPALDLACAQSPNAFGDRICTAVIGSFNQYPARALSLFFKAERLSAVKVLYQRAYHAQIRAWVERRPGLRGATAGPHLSQGVGTWQVAGGTLVMRDGELGRSDEPALFWLSTAAIQGWTPPGG